MVEVTKTTYKAHAARAGRWWAVEVPDVPGVFTQTRRLDQVAPAAREAIALMLDIDPDLVDVVVEPELPAELVEAITAARAAQADAERARSEAADRARAVVIRLQDEMGLTVRDVGQVIGVSYQRVQQLVAARADR